MWSFGPLVALCDLPSGPEEDFLKYILCVSNILGLGHI
jgi:hypothetical protein